MATTMSDWIFSARLIFFSRATITESYGELFRSGFRSTNPETRLSPCLTLMLPLGNLDSFRVEKKLRRGASFLFPGRINNSLTRLQFSGEHAGRKGRRGLMKVI